MMDGVVIEGTCLSLPAIQPVKDLRRISICSTQENWPRIPSRVAEFMGGAVSATILRSGATMAIGG
jgi:hypothetical protein